MPRPGKELNVCPEVGEQGLSSPMRPSSGAGWQPGAWPPSLLFRSAAKSRACHPLGTNKQETDTNLALAPLPQTSSLPTGPRPACLSLPPKSQDKGCQSQIEQQIKLRGLGSWGKVVVVVRMLHVTTRFQPESHNSKVHTKWPHF